MLIGIVAMLLVSVLYVRLGFAPDIAPSEASVGFPRLSLMSL
ncbi:MAG: hypothetical protein WB816_10790 [Methylocystis sp.]